MNHDRNLLRRLLGKLPAGLLVILALWGSWALVRRSGGGVGTVIGYAEARVHQVGSLQPGRLLSVQVRLGQEVRAGQELARLDPRPLSLARERAAAALRLAEARLTAEPDLQMTQMEQGELVLLRSKGEEERARAELEQLDLRLARLDQLRAQSLVRATEVEEARRQRQALAAELLVREQAARAQGQSRRVHTKTELQQRLKLRLQPLQAEVLVQAAALREAELALEQATLRAPADGTIGAILHQPGDAVAAGAPIVTVIAAPRGRVEAFVPEPRARALRHGAAAELRRTGVWRAALRGRVVELSPHVEEVPLRVRPAATTPAWGRRVVIEVSEGEALLPGESFHINLP